MRFRWSILVGLIGGVIQSIPFWEIFDPNKALSERRIIFLAMFASWTLIPAAIGFIAGRDSGGSKTQHILAALIAGVFAASIATGLLYILPTSIQSKDLFMFFLFIFVANIIFSTAGGALSIVFKI